MSKISKIILVLLIVILAISSYFIFKELAENKKENDIYKDLQEIIENPTNENDNTDILKSEEGTLSSANKENNYNLENISKINSDVVAWIKIDRTNINYPIMQNGDFYLNKNIYKKYSSHGTPYLASYCDLKKSDNLIIYGHHMNDNTMFSQLEKYKSYNFYLKHKYIKLYTLENRETIENKYEVIYAFKTIAYSEKGFKYYNYTDFQKTDDYQEFADKCQALEFYRTGVVGTHKDKYITLSTCEYSQKNGRMVVVAKKI